MRLVALPLFAGLAAAKLGCVDESGAPVNWWFMYKHPRWASKGGECVGNCNGDAYVYTTSASPDAWTVAKSNVAETSSLLGLVLAGIYDGTVSNYVFYNDQLPDGGYSSTYGHSKGFFAYDSDSAFWVQHSIPDFPNYVDEGYLYGSGQMYYGQHAFCMSLTPATLDDIAVVMRYANPQVYQQALADTSVMPNVAALVAGEKLSPTIITTVDVGWATLHLQGKASSADVDMLGVLTAPALKVSLNSQSWLNSGGPIGGFCPKGGYNVTDIAMIQLPPSDVHETYVDHSKWAVTAVKPAAHNAKGASHNSSAAGWICALDNNHVQSQETRSGLAVCMQQPGLVSLMQGAAQAVDGCGPDPSPTPEPGSCCYYADAECVPGQICCSSSGTSYVSEGSCDEYGAVHGCEWLSEECIIPDAPDGCNGNTTYPCAVGCTYVHDGNASACGVDYYGCYNCSALNSGCPECAAPPNFMKVTERYGIREMATP